MFNETKYSEKKDITLRNDSELDPILSVLLFFGIVVLGLATLLGRWNRINELANLPLHQAENENSRFQEINVIPHVTLSSYYGQTLEVAGDDIFILGYIKQGYNDFVPGSVWNPEQSLSSLDYATGNINWQAEAKPISVVLDKDSVFGIKDAEELGDAPWVVAYNLASGERVWETQLDSKNAIGGSNISASNNTLFLKTSSRSSRGFYAVDMRSGEILRMYEEGIKTAFFAEDDLSSIYHLEQFSVISKGQNDWSATIIDGCGYCSLDNAVVTDGLILVKSLGTPFHGNLYALDRYSGALLWRIEDHIISNVAVDGDTAYYLNASAELVAANIDTGEKIATLNFSPGFPEDIDFQNSDFLVAASNGTIATYFSNSRQLFIFNFE